MRACRMVFHLRVVLGVLLGLNVAPVQALTYLVGNDVCNFTSIQLAINAAQSNPGPDTIRIASNRNYAGLALKILQQDLTIEGGYASCAEARIANTPPTGRTILSGNGLTPASVIEFQARGQYNLRGLDLIEGDSPVSGGGIQFNGSGTLYLENVVVTNNTSAYGGGINFHGSGAAVGFLTLGPDVVVNSNTATESGGGIRLTGQSRLQMVEDGISVTNNEARGASSDQVGHGGGILIVGPAEADIASPGLDGAAIYGNYAKYGGGLAVLAPDDGAVARLYSVDPALPLRIRGNRATIAGGGIYLGGDDDDFAESSIDAFEIQVEQNRAPLGAAIYANEGARFGFNANAIGIASAGSCTPIPTPACSRISGNRSEDADGRPTTGAVVAARESENSSIVLQRVALTDNVGGTVLHRTSCSGCLLVRNQVSVGLAVFPRLPEGFFDPSNDFVQYFIVDSTIADNQIEGRYVFRYGRTFLVRDSIVHQPGKLLALLDGSDAEVRLESLLVHACSALPFDCSLYSNVFAPESGPRFVDPARYDYRPQAASPAVDASNLSGGSLSDLDGNLRPVAVNPTRAALGTRDLGAYERQTLEPLVSNGDFVTDIHPWQLVAAASVVSGGAAGNPGGMAMISDDNNRATNTVVGLRQCVALPMPGQYRLTGLAAGQGFLSHQRDHVKLRWHYFRRSTGGPCAGTPTQSGEVLFPNSGALSLPVADAFISAPPSEFNALTEVLIELVAIEGNTIAANDSTGGMFDGIRLIPPGSTPR